jgi:hypothetical protein
MNRLGDDLRRCDRRRVQRRAAPRRVNRHPGEIDNRSVATIAAQVVRRAHKNTIDRARLDAQRAKHAFRVIDRKGRDLEALATRHALFADVDAVDRARLRALIAGDARRQIVAVETTIAGRDRNGQLRVFEVLGKRQPLRIVRFEPIPQRNSHTLSDRPHRNPNVSKPFPHRRGFAF